MSKSSTSASGPASRPSVFRRAHRAMATMFEIFIADLDKAEALDVAEAAFVEIDRMERLLSRYNPYSDISRINAAKPGKDVVVEVEAAECIQTAFRVWKQTDGAFDITAGSPLATGIAPKAPVGMQRIVLDEDSMSVRRLDAKVRLDLGGIGKGFALDLVTDLLDEWGVKNALCHGGTSTVLAMGSRPGRDGWQADLQNPSGDKGDLGSVLLKDCSFSGSSTAHSRHIIHPRTGKAIPADRAAWALADDATTADALTTALCVMDDDEIRRFARRNPKLSFFLGRRVDGKWRLQAMGPKVMVE